MSAVIRFKAVTKGYRVHNRQPFLARRFVSRILQRPTHIARHTALVDVTFEVERGESVGIVGANGSGKTTLLSLVARTTHPTQGTVYVEGRVGPLLGLGAGFHPDLTGYENLYLNASLLGLTRREVESAFLQLDCESRGRVSYESVLKWWKDDADMGDYEMV